MSDAAFDLLDAVDDRVDELSAALAPLLQRTVQDTAASLTVADKARLYVLTTFAVESLLFSYLRLQGVQTKDHAVMRELTRVRQYMAKIKAAEPAAVPAMALDKAAANRFIAAALAGNDKYDVERAETVARERAGAEAKLKALEQRRGEEGAVEDTQETVSRRAEDSDEEGDMVIINDTEEDKATKKKRKRRKKDDDEDPDEDGKKKKSRKRSKAEKAARREERRENKKDVRMKNKGATS